MKYGLYYKYKEIGDKLRIIFSCEKKNTIKKSIEYVDIFYDDNKIAEIDINGFSNFAKIKINGLIPLINNEFLKLINSILENKNLPRIQSQENSGFYVCQVLEVNEFDKCNDLKLVKITIGNDKEIEVISKGENLIKGMKCIFAEEGTFLNNETQVKKIKYKDFVSSGILCTATDLDFSINDDLIIELGDGFEIGEDFYKLM